MSETRTSIPSPFLDPGELAAEAGSLDAERLAALERWAERAAGQAQAPEWRKQGAKLLEEKRAGAEAHAAYALLLDHLEETAEATRQLVVLCERLSQHGAWPAVAAVARHAVELGAGTAAARWLVRATDAIGDPESRFQALREAHEAAPAEPRLAWRLARALEERGNSDEAAEIAVRAVGAFSRRREVEELEEILLEILERPRREVLVALLEGLASLARGAPPERVSDLFELAWPAWREAGLAEHAWRVLRAFALELDEAGPFLRHFPAVAPLAHPTLEGVEDLLRESGLGSDAAPRTIVERFERLLPFAPGAFAEHRSWGVGRVRRLAGEELWIDFPERPEHRMTLRAAHQALVPVSPDDISVLASWDPERFARLQEEDPVSLVTRALERFGPEASTAEIKRALLHYGLPEAEWTGFWNRARKRFPADPRIDDHQAYRGRYRLREEAEAAGEDEGPGLPRFDRRSDPRRTLNTIRRFLAQHPEQARPLARSRALALGAWAENDAHAWRERTGAWLVLAEDDDPEVQVRVVAGLARAYRDGFELRELPSAGEQSRALELGLAGEAWKDAARGALGSRFTEVRGRAFAALEERLGEDAQAFYERAVRTLGERPESGLAVLTLAFGRGEGSPALEALDPWAAAIALAEHLESGAANAVAKGALALFTPTGTLARRARTRPLDENRRAALERLLARWRGTDRHLLPYLEWLEAAGEPEIAERVRERRRSAARAITGSAETVAVHELERPLLSRATFEKLRLEAEEIQQALRGEIPAAIQKARELGDLRENAEYESAKLKQRNAQARLVKLAQRLQNPILIDDLDPVPDLISVGSDVELELADGRPRRCWILGEGEDHLGSEVVSYKAAVGRALLGKRVGETVELPGETAGAAVVRSITHRLPPTP